MFFNSFVAPAEVGVGQGHKHQRYEDGKNHRAEHPGLGPQWSELLMAGFAAGGGSDGRGDLLKQHFLPY
jgi:hypothetical protein